MSSISGNSLHNAFNGSGNLTFNSIEGSASQVLGPERSLISSPENCFPHLRVMMQMRHPGYLTTPEDKVESTSDSYNVYSVVADAISQTL